MHRHLLTFLAVLLSSGCYTFQPAAIEDVLPGQNIRARVTGAYSDTLGVILQRDVRVFEGKVFEAADSSILVDVSVEAAFRGMRLETLNQRVEIPHTVFVDVETKELSKGRTFMAVAAVVGVISALVIGQVFQDTGGADRPGSGGPQDAVVTMPGVTIGSARGPGITIPLGFRWLGGR